MLINLRNALMAGKRLPYDAEVEYLESSGTQYINTGVYADNETAVELLCKYTQAFQDNAVISMDAGNNLTRAFTIEMYNGRIYFSFSDTLTQNASLQSSWNQISASQNGLIVNGTSVGVSQAPAFQCEYPLFVFCYGRKGVPIIYGKWQIASCKIYKNGAIVRDYIPVRKGAVGYLYDRVTGKLFGNAGTGDFVLGPDVVPVEYVGIDNGAYINTGVVVSQASMQAGLDVEIGASFAVRALRQATFKDGKPYFFVGTNGTGKFYSGLGQGADNTNVANDGAMHVLRISSTTGAFSIDGEVATQYQSPTYTGSVVGDILIGACSEGTDAPLYFASMRVAECSIRNNNALASHFLPVRVGTDATSWEGAMMDVLTRRIYRNAGTGAFTYGNDLKYPIPAE